MVPTSTYVLIYGIPIIYIVACTIMWVGSKNWLAGSTNSQAKKGSGVQG